jgi:Fe-S cluster assembly scaffold protein SufB
MESRGIADRLARKMLTYGFAADVLAEVQVPEIRQRMEHLVFQRLDDAGEAAA